MRERGIFKSLVLLSAALIMSSCGGGGSAPEPSAPPPPSHAPSQIIVIDGDQQHTFAGGNLLYPVQVAVADETNLGVPGVQVTFTGSDGVQIFPSTVVTGPAGDARALVRLPEIPFSTFEITASVDKVSTKLTEFSGPRLVQVFGAANASNGAVTADGTYYAQGPGTVPTHGPGGSVFASDGTLKAYLGSSLGKINFPDAGTVGQGGRDYIATAVGFDNNVYFFNQALFAMFVLDPELNLIKFLDFGANNPSSVGSFDFDSYFTIAPNGNIYWASYPGIVKAYDSTGIWMTDVFVNPPNSASGIAATNTNNFVMLVNDSTLSSATLSEYNLQAELVRNKTIMGRSVGLAHTSTGAYAVFTCCLPATVMWLDEHFQEIRRTDLDFPQGNWSGGFYVDDL